MATDDGEFRSRQAEHNRAAAAKRREIGELPAVANPRRRAKGRRSLLDFCRLYFPNRFKLKFSSAHKEAAARMERCTADGGLFSLAFMRGGGKTTLAEAAVLRAILYGFRRFAVLIQATQPLASRSLRKIQRELESNDLLLADFPEACFPIRALERNALRARMQTHNGRLTLIEWTGDGAVLPTIEGSSSSGAVLHVAGMTGAVRGLSRSGPDGGVLRPDLVIIDDAQTRDSAKSPTQTADLEAIVSDDILGLSGPDQVIAAINLCTPIYVNDLAERFLDREAHPEWNALRTRMLERMPARMDLWDRYGDLLLDSLRAGGGGKAATDFYKANRKDMDAGAVASWPERKKAKAYSGVSAVELAMKLYYRNPRGFAAEFQCTPTPEAEAAGTKSLDAKAVASRLSGCERHQVPREGARLTAFVDCGAGLHWFAVVAWTEQFGGAVVDYGCWPRQARAQFEARDARPALPDVYPGGESAAVFAGLRDLTAELLGRAYQREGGGELSIERLLIDSGWQTKTVYQFVRQSPHRGLVYPSKGVGRTTTARGVSEWKPRPGERVGFHWRLTAGEDGKGRAVQFDPDAWKTFLHERLTVPLGSPACLTLFGRADGGRGPDHAMLGAHLAAEYGSPVTLRGQTFDKWAVRPDRPDNHLWDVLVGCAVAASVQGLAFAAGGAAAPKAKKSKVNIEDLYRRQRQGA